MKKNCFVVSKMTRICWILTWALKILKISFLIGSFYANYIKLDLQKYRGVIFHDTEDRCKIWRKTDLWFRKWHEEYGKFSPEHSKVSKVGLWWGPFLQSRKCTSLNHTEELCVMTMKNDAKFEKELTSRVKNRHEDFDKFWLEHSKVQNFAL